MKLSVVQVPRRLHVGKWVVLAALAYASLGAAAVAASRRAGEEAALCVFKRLTGLPCPTCGFTRGLVHMGHCRVIDGWLCNPLLFSVLALLAASLLLRVAFGRAVSFGLGRRGRWLAAALAAGAVLANWGYVLVYVG